jgi:hypothetical protein
VCQADGERFVWQVAFDLLPPGRFFAYEKSVADVEDRTVAAAKPCATRPRRSNTKQQ